MTNIRIGNGFDVHRLVEGRELWMCGVKIPYHMGLLGHSDADVALHALCDAILGAAALRDIGYHFPDTDERYKGADSRVLLRECCRMVREKGYEIGNVDVTIIAQAPKMLPPHTADDSQHSRRCRYIRGLRFSESHHNGASRFHRPWRRDCRPGRGVTNARSLNHA